MMTSRTNPALLASCLALALANIVASPQASAVGYGLEFDVNESAVPSTRVHPAFEADSLDFTYHACVDIEIPVAGNFYRTMDETGYFWISSYQDEGTVLDSQINYYDDPVTVPIAVAFPFADDNGYRIYAKYHYFAGQPVAPQPTLTGVRLSYLVSPNEAYIELYVDPDSDTVLGLDDQCALTIENSDDDALLGSSTNVAQGEKYETDGLANGDFKLVFSEWTFQSLPWAGENPLLNPVGGAPFDFLVFNGNVTELGGPLANDHNPEGSGNLFWL
ncbi:MAG: hypothetical protein ACR2RL_18820, partial [Gammaproteobacteria bacterium]